MSRALFFTRSEAEMIVDPLDITYAIIGEGMRVDLSNSIREMFGMLYISPKQVEWVGGISDEQIDELRKKFVELVQSVKSESESVA
jgi:hypothetical protein